MPESVQSRSWTVTVTHSPKAAEGPLESVVATAVPAKDAVEAVRRAVDMADALGEREGGTFAARSGLAQNALDDDADSGHRDVPQRKFHAYPVGDRETVMPDELDDDHDSDN